MSNDRTPALAAIYVNPTDRCNLRCRHCWLSPGHMPAGPGGESRRPACEGGLSAAVMRDVVEQALPLGLHTVKLTGGEPFLRQDLMDFIALFHEKGLQVDIETNATLIDASTAQDLRRYEVRSVSVSLDGARGETHDPFRGVEKAFDAALEGIGHLRTCGLDIQIIMSLHRGNAGEVEALALLAAELGAGSLKINPVLPIGRGREMYHRDRTLSAAELLTLARRVRTELQPRVKVPLHFCLPVAFQPLGVIMDGGHGECALFNILGIVENGDISFCGIQKVEQGLVMGNIHRDRIADIWRHHPLLKALREDVPRRLEGICGRCFFKKVCLGSCRACAYHMERRMTAPYWLCQEAFEEGLFPATRYCH